MTPLKLTMYIFAFTCIVPAFIGLKHFRKLTPDLKALTLYALVSVLFEIPSTYYSHHNKNNLFILHAYTVVEFVFFTYIYSFHISKIINRKILFAVGVLFVTGSILNTLFVQSIVEFNTYSRCIEILIVIFYTLCYIYALIINDEQKPLKQIPMMWVNTAVLIYFIAGFFLYLVSKDTFTLPRHHVKTMWAVHGFLLASYYLILAKALWVQSKS